MGPTRSPGRSPVSDVYRYSGLGCLFAAGVLLFVAGGWLADRWLGIFPVLTVVGALVGAALSTLSVYRRVDELHGGTRSEDSQE